MSFKGQIEARCPNGCEPFSAEIWSFIRGDRSPELRELVLWRECNLLLCSGCNTAFIPAEPYIYFEPKAEVLAFVFPESYRDREQYWRGKMHEDFMQMRQALNGEIPLDFEPQIFFGVDELAELLEDENYRGEEGEVMEALAAELGLSTYRISPRFARERGIPPVMPLDAERGARPTKAAVVAALERLLGFNDRLTGYQKALDALREKTADLPPAAPVLH